MNAANPSWIDVLEWMQAVQLRLPAALPPELCTEIYSEFWPRAGQIEMTRRDTLSATIRSLVTTGELPAIDPIDCWFFHRRIEWAAQLLHAKAKQRIEPNVPLRELLMWLLIGSWESDGCVAFWNNCERD